MALYFDKFHATGNDFIVTGSAFNLIENPAGRIKLLCNRHFGIGADGLILCESSKVADIKMLYYNSDGSGNTLCANGIRAAAAWGFKHWKLKKNLTIEASDGIHHATILSSDEDVYRISVSMNDITQITPYKDGFYLNSGSPHFVIPTPDADSIEIEKEGKFWRNHERFAPHGTNVNFITLQNSEIRIRTYERGVEAETLSCGTGVTAAAAVAAFLQHQTSPDYSFITQGGRLTVSLKNEGARCKEIVLTGEAQFVFAGNTIL